MYKYSIVFFLKITLLIHSLSFSQSYSYDEINRIDKNDYSPQEIYEIPKTFDFDHQGNLYVAGYNDPYIIKYDGEGNFISKFGGEGKGPGEFLEISTIFFDSKNSDIVAMDRFNLRLTRFNLDGEVVETVQFPNENSFSPLMGANDSEGNIFLLYRNFTLPNQPKVTADNLIHVYDSGFKEYKSSFLEVEIFTNADENYFVDRITGGSTTGYFELISDHLIAAVPYIYSGKIILFKKEENDWVTHKTLYGKILNDQPYEQIDFNTAPEYSRRIGTPRGAIAGLIYNESVGIDLINDKYLVVFTIQRDKKSFIGEFGYSLFNYATGEFIRYEKITELSSDSLDPLHPVLKIKYNQTNDAFYFVDYRSDEPEIVMANIHFDLP